LLRGDESTSGTVRRLFTRETVTDAFRPALVVTFTPGGTAPVARLLVSGPTNVGPNSPFSITVTAQDSNGNVVPSYAGTVTFSSSDPNAPVLPADYTFTAADQGTHTFSGVKLFSLGTQTISAQDTADGSILGTATVTVTAAPSGNLVITAPATA